MSNALINRSPDLKRLRDEGYTIEIKGGHLIVGDVPYVNSGKEVKIGTFVSKLDTAGDKANKPENHVIFFSGEYPCNYDGSKITALEHGSQTQDLGFGIVVNHSFSNRPKDGYKDYHEKVSTYIEIVSSQARVINPKVTAKMFRPISTTDDESVFVYEDTSTSRNEIGAVTQKLVGHKIGIVGLGGTGSYVLDFVSKTPVAEIHLYDGDYFSSHNAFRSPSAASIEELGKLPLKTEYFSHKYSNMHRKVISHPIFINKDNVDNLSGLDFIFLCMDVGTVKKVVLEKAEQMNISFIDVGMGLHLVENALGGIVRVTTSSPENRTPFRTKVSFSDDNADNEYNSNIQIAELNALNATLAIIKWKKMLGFYHDFDNEHFCAYTVDGNHMLNEDKG